VSDRLVCLRCGQVVDVYATVCPRCGTSFTGGPSPLPGAAGTTSAYAAGPPGTPVLGRSAPSHTLRNVLILVVIAVVAIVILFTWPVSHSFSDSLTINDRLPGAHFLYFPTNAPVSLSWSASGGTNAIEVGLWSTEGTEIYAANGTSGSFAFTANGDPYLFEVSTESAANVAVSLQGTYTTAIL
jgi:hypothetical protein